MMGRNETRSKRRLTDVTKHYLWWYILYRQSSGGSNWSRHGVRRGRAGTMTIADGTRISGSLLPLSLFHHLMDTFVVCGQLSDVHVITSSKEHISTMFRQQVDISSWWPSCTNRHMQGRTTENECSAFRFITSHQRATLEPGQRFRSSLEKKYRCLFH